jgi:hypothetical protein
MVDVLPKGEIDILHPKVSISYALTAIIVVVMLLAIIGVGGYLYTRAKAMVPTAGPSGADF